MKNHSLLLERRGAAAALLAAVLSMAFAPVPAPKPSPSKEELRRLQGEWEQARFSYNGHPWQEGLGVADVYSGGRLSCVRRGKVIARYEVALDPYRRPRAMDLKGAGGALLRCSYRLEGDELTVAYWVKDRKEGRPADLRPREGIWVMVYKRARKGP